MLGEMSHGAIAAAGGIACQPPATTTTLDGMSTARGLPDEPPLIEYPCDWTYKVIGRNADAIGAAVDAIIGLTRCTLTPGNADPISRLRSRSDSTAYKTSWPSSRSALTMAVLQHSSAKNSLA